MLQCEEPPTHVTEPYKVVLTPSPLLLSGYWEVPPSNKAVKKPAFSSMRFFSFGEVGEQDTKQSKTDTTIYLLCLIPLFFYSS